MGSYGGLADYRVVHLVIFKVEMFAELQFFMIYFLKLIIKKTATDFCQRVLLGDANSEKVTHLERRVE